MTYGTATATRLDAGLSTTHDTVVPPHPSLVALCRDRAAESRWHGVRPVEWRQNVLRQTCGPQSRLVHIANMNCEVIFGNKDFNRATDGIFAPYSPRYAGMLPPNSAILVPASIASVVRQTIRHLENSGLAAGGITVIGVAGDPNSSLAQLVIEDISDVKRALAATGSSYTGILPFIGSTRVNTIAGELGLSVTPDNVAAVNRVNHKGYSSQQLRKRGVTCTDGRWVRGATTDEALVQYDDLVARHPGRAVWAKLARAATGMGVKKVASRAELEAFLNEPIPQHQLQDRELGIVLDMDVPSAAGLPNIMLFVGNTPEQDRFVTASQQILDKKNETDDVASVHVGNIGIQPGSAAWRIIHRDVPTYLAFLRDEGFRGFAGVDVILDLERDCAVYLETNGRLNGNCAASYTAIGAGPECIWAAHNKTPVPPGSTLGDYLAYLDHQGVLYNSRTSHGVYVVNAALMAKGCVQIGVRAESEERAQHLLAAAKWSVG